MAPVPAIASMVARAFRVRVRIEELAADFLPDYRINGKKSLADVEARWKLHLKPFFGFLRAVDVTSDLLGRYVDARQGEGAVAPDARNGKAQNCDPEMRYKSRVFARV